MDVYFESNKENLIKSPNENNAASNVNLTLNSQNTNANNNMSSNPVAVAYHHMLGDGGGKLMDIDMEIQQHQQQIDQCNKMNLLGMDNSKHLLISALNGHDDDSHSPPASVGAIASANTPATADDLTMLTENDENDPSLKEIEDSLAMSPGTAASLNMSDFNGSMSAGNNSLVSNHTFKKTEWDVKKFETHVRATFGDMQPVETMPPELLNSYINNFFEFAKKGDGMEYEPESLIGYMNSFERYLKAKNYPESLLRSDLFSDTRSMLKRKRDLVRTIGRLVRLRNKDTPYLLKFYRNLFKEKGLLNRENPDCLLAEVRSHA
jgi:hypothetical protein